MPISKSMTTSIFDLGHKNSKLFCPTTIKGKIIRVNQSKSEEYARQIVCRHCRSIYIMKNDWIFHERMTKKSFRIIKDDMHLSEMERRKNKTKKLDQILGFKFQCECLVKGDAFITRPVFINFQEVDIQLYHEDSNKENEPTKRKDNLNDSMILGSKGAV